MDKENIPHVHESRTRRKPPQINHIPIASRKGMWTNEALEITMDVKRGTCSLRRARMSWNILLSSFIDHLNSKTRSKKMGPRGVFTKEEDVAMIKWTLNVLECRLSINLQQLKMKVAKLTQTKDTPFKDGILRKSWWYWFKQRHP
jgi:hypothetical protein